jgi:uncharacterized membrane protein YraQ (UPF0718 family)
MLSLLSTIGGLLVSGLPKLLEFFQNKADQSHEIALARLQNEMQMQMMAAGFAAQAKIEEIRTDQIALQTDAQMTEAALKHDEKVLDRASKWVANYVGTVRPTITYLFVAELIAINAAITYYVFQHPGLVNSVEDLVNVTSIIFSDDEMAMLGGIIGYWMGTRSWGRK